MTPVVPPFSFAQAAPPPFLTDWVDALWVARGTIAYTRERIMPTTSPVLIINLGSPFRVRASRRDDGDGFRTDGWIVGPQTGYVENIPTAETNVVGATLQPWGASVLFGIDTIELKDRIVDLDLLWGPGLGRLRERLDRSTDASWRIRVLAESLAARRTAGLPIRRTGPPSRVEYAATQLARPMATSVSRVSAELEVSRKHLNALFGRYVGLSPRTFTRIQRFNHALQGLAGPESPSLAQVAHDLGYYDQAHMNRDFVTFGEITPTEYLRQRARHMTADGDDSGLFVPGL